MCRVGKGDAREQAGDAEGDLHSGLSSSAQAKERQSLRSNSEHHPHGRGARYEPEVPGETEQRRSQTSAIARRTSHHTGIVRGLK